MRKYLLPLIAALACMACEKTIELDVPLEDSKLVLHGYLNPDSTLKVQLTRSLFVLDRMDKRMDVAGATVKVFEDEKEIGSMVYKQNGWYELEGVRPKEGRSYRIEAEKAGFEKISASERLLAGVPVGTITVDTVNEQQNGNLYSSVEVAFTIEDQPGKNYYIPTATHYIKARGFNPYTGTEEVMEMKNSYYLQSGEPYVESFCYNNCVAIVTDSYVDGKNIKVKLRGSFHSYPQDWTILEETYYVKLYHASPSYYLYHATLNKNYENDGNPFSEPTPVFTNVEGGYGVLGALNPTYKEF